jgi:CRISPR/Cas system CSM-associated protein Csm4 (group 5 of RAMP superfamily)
MPEEDKEKPDEKKASEVNSSKEIQKPNGEEERDGDSVAEIYENLPPEAKKLVSAFRATSTPVFAPPLHKIDASHITQVIENAEKSEQREYNDRSSQRKYQVFYALLATGVFVFLIYWFSDSQPDLLTEILKAIVFALGGFGAGYGVAKRKKISGD